jgi:transcriptional regulator with XRE-family HTH domain
MVASSEETAFLGWVRSRAEWCKRMKVSRQGRIPPISKAVTPMSKSVTWSQLREQLSQGTEPADTPEYAQARAAYYLGGVIHAARTHSGKSQSQLAQMLNVSQPAVARLERSANVPNVLTLHRIARALGKELLIGFVSSDDLRKHEALLATGEVVSLSDVSVARSSSREGPRSRATRRADDLIGA